MIKLFALAEENIMYFWPCGSTRDCPLCSFGVEFYLQPQVLSSHSWHYQYPAEKGLKQDLLQIPGTLLTALSSFGLCLRNLSCWSFQNSQSFLLNSGRLLGSAGSPPPHAVTWKQSPVIKMGNHSVHLIYFSSQWSLSCIAWCPMSENCCFIYFIQCSIYCRHENKSDPCYSIFVKSRSS